MEEEIRWIVTDPLGNDIILKEQTFTEHIQDDHQVKDSANRAAVEEQVKYTIQCPRFIIKNGIEGRFKYLDLVDIIEGDIIKIKTLTVVVDYNNSNAVVTWMIKRSINYSTDEGEIIYDARKRMVAGTDL